MDNFGKGYGSLLTQKALAIAFESGCRTVELQTTCEASILFASLGFFPKRLTKNPDARKVFEILPLFEKAHCCFFAPNLHLDLNKSIYERAQERLTAPL